MATAERATKNLKIELDRFNQFCKSIIIPVLADIQLSHSEYRKPVTITATQVSEDYGHSASKAFSLMFKRLAKHKVDETGKRGGSLWLPYPKALFHFSKWLETTEEETCRSLLKYLEAAGVQQMTWHPALRQWVSAEALAAIKACADDPEMNDGIDYGKLYKSLTTTA